MARRPAPPPRGAQLTVDQMQRGIAVLRRRLEDLAKFNPETAQDHEVTALERAIDEALERVFGNDTTDYNRYHSATLLDDGPISMGGGPVRDTRRYLAEGKQKATALLQQAVRALEERIADAGPLPAAGQIPSEASAEKSNCIFIVHGHDQGPRESVARFVSGLGFEPIILHEQASQSATIIEKFEKHSIRAGYAIVLLTPDDLGGASKEDLQPRARQNVVLEFGYFLGSLGRARVCALVKDKVELPSDMNGIVYVPLDDAGAWRQALARELQEAGYIIDWNKVMR
jgi:predicted nucleotide-binding protein